MHRGGELTTTREATQHEGKDRHRQKVLTRQSNKKQEYVKKSQSCPDEGTRQVLMDGDLTTSKQTGIF